MLSLFFILLSFSSSLTCDQTKCLFLNDEPCMVRPTLIDLNSVELKYYPLMISLNKCLEVVMSYHHKYVSKETKDINVKVFNMITNKNEAKSMTEHISYDCKCKFNSTVCNSNQKWNNKTCQCECKKFHMCKKYYSWNPSTHICENSKYLRSNSTKKTNTTSTASINCHSIKVRGRYILHTVLLAIILLFIMIIFCNHYAKQEGII